ncbi:MAG: hypothetical protein BWZ04_02426 [Firmicutes bacterium ADurb.BinA205]|nr:MAG: hypothetical protein BWZ04_02426 [Firmicutes bacterium ADurb.BinA205]
MDIVKSEFCDAELVKQLSHETIESVYPHYYPRGAVDFFLAHHSMDHIIKDIEEGNVWLIYSDGKAVGTVTINENEINRLFVLPQCQGKGFGRELMLFAEKTIFSRYDTAKLSASLPAKAMYLKNGYEFSEYHIIDCNNGDKLCYDYLIKRKS